MAWTWLTMSRQLVALWGVSTRYLGISLLPVKRPEIFSTLARAASSPRRDGRDLRCGLFGEMDGPDCITGARIGVRIRSLARARTILGISDGGSLQRPLGQEVASGIGLELLAAAPRAEVVGHTCMLEPVGRFLALDRHLAHRVLGHRHHLFELAVLEPEHPVGDLFDPLVVADDDDASSLLLGHAAQEPH